MRILYIPFFSNQPNHNGCSIYNTMKHFFRAIVDHDESAYVYFLVPKENYAYDIVLDHPRIEKVPVEFLGKDQYDEKVLVPKELYDLFNEDIGTKYYDAVICDKVHIANYVKLILFRKFKTEGSQTVPYITLTQFVVRLEGRFKNMLDEYEFAQCLGWLSSFNIFENERNAKVCFDIARKYLQPSYVRKIMDNSNVQNIYGINVEGVRKHKKPNSYIKGQKIRINYAHRTATHYKFEEIVELVDYLFSGGLPIEFIITTPSSNIGGYGARVLRQMKEKGLHVEVHEGLNQEEFYKIASTCHLFLEAIDELQSPNAIFETMYLGQVGIIKDYEWVNHFLPNYPFKYNNFNEAFELVKRFADNPTPMIDNLKNVDAMLERDYVIQTNAIKCYEWIKTKVMPQFTAKQNVIDIIKEISETVKLPEELTFEEFTQFIKKNTTTKLDIDKPSFRKINKFDFIQALLQMGYSDTNKEILAFRKVKE
jgi:hypothetical protein